MLKNIITPLTPYTLMWYYSRINVWIISPAIFNHILFFKLLCEGGGGDIIQVGSEINQGYGWYFSGQWVILFSSLVELFTPMGDLIQVTGWYYSGQWVILSTSLGDIIHVTGSYYSCLKVILFTSGGDFNQGKGDIIHADGWYSSG